MNRDERDQLIADATALEFTLQAAGQDDEARIVGSLAIELRRLVEGLEKHASEERFSFPGKAPVCADVIMRRKHARALLEGTDGKDDGAAEGKSPDIPSSFWDDPFA